MVQGCALDTVHLRLLGGRLCARLYARGSVRESSPHSDRLKDFERSKLRIFEPKNEDVTRDRGEIS